MIKKLLLLIYFSFNFYSIWANSKCVSDTSIQIIPQWEIGESHIVNFSSLTQDSSRESKKESTTSFQIRFSILDKSDSGYKIEWIYLNSQLDASEMNPENFLFHCLVGEKIIFSLSSSGNVGKLLNRTEIKARFNSRIDSLLRGSEGNISVVEKIKMIKQVVISDDAFQLLVEKHISFYTSLYGGTYSTDSAAAEIVEVPSLFGGNPYKATRKRRVTELNKENKICSIISETIVDTKYLAQEINEFLKKDNNIDSNSRAIVSKYKLTFSEIAFRQYNFGNGIILMATYKRTMKLGLQNRVTIWRMETVN